MKNLIEKWTKEQIKIIIEHYKIQINLCKASGWLKITCFYVKIYNVLWQQTVAKLIEYNLNGEAEKDIIDFLCENL